MSMARRHGHVRLIREGLLTEVYTPRHQSYLTLTYTVKKDGLISICRHRVHLDPEDHISLVCDAIQDYNTRVLGRQDGSGCSVGDPDSYFHEVVQTTKYHRLHGPILYIRRSPEESPRLILGDMPYLREVSQEILGGMGRTERREAMMYIGILVTTSGFSGKVDSAFQDHIVPPGYGVDWEIILREDILPTYP